MGEREAERTDRSPSRERTGPRNDDPVLPDVTGDERDVGWGDPPSDRDDDWYRRERPPHHE